jgi:hypothetical protein
MAVAVVDEGGLLMSQHAVHGIKDPFWYLDLSAHTLQVGGREAVPSCWSSDAF